MSSVDFSINFGRRVGAARGDLGRLWSDAQDAIEEARFRWQEDLLEVWPVDTGTSLQAWDNYTDGLVWVLRNGVEYASFVHAAGDDQPIWEYLQAQAETYAQDVVAELNRLLTRARAEEGAQASLFGARGVQRPSVSGLVSGAVFRALARSFERPGRGARQRLRERFPNQPIGRAASRQRDRSRLR